MCLDFTFWLLASFFPGIGGRFCNARAWVVFLTFLELLVHFSIHVFVISCVFYHGCEKPFTFLAVSLTFGSHALAIWDVFPCCELVSLISFRTVCFPPCCEPFLLLRMGLCNSFLLFKLCWLNWFPECNSWSLDCVRSEDFGLVA